MGERALIISVGHVWNLPFGPGQKFLSNKGTVVGQIVSGWNFSGITVWMSGDPLNVTESNTASLNATAAWTLRPNRIGSGRVSQSNHRAMVGQNPAAFRTPAAIYVREFKSENILRGPSLLPTGLGFVAPRGSFRIKEDKRVLFEWQVFDAFNRINLADPTTNISSSLVGTITGISNPVRTMQEVGFTLVLLMDCVIGVVGYPDFHGNTKSRYPTVEGSRDPW